MNKEIIDKYVNNDHLVLEGASEKPNNPEGLDELVNSYLEEHRHDVLLSPYNGLMEFAKLVCEWQKNPVEGLDEAAEAYADGPDCTWVGVSALEQAFKAGAEWMAGQGSSIEGTVEIVDLNDGQNQATTVHYIYEHCPACVTDTRIWLPVKDCKDREKVIVQIRKKKD